MREPYAFACRNCKRVSEIKEIEGSEPRCPNCGSGAGFYGPRSEIAPLYPSGTDAPPKPRDADGNDSI